MIGKNMDGEITSWNRAAEKMYGYTAAEAVGRDLSFLLPSEGQAEIRAIMERVQSGSPIDCLETQRLTKEGSVLDVSLSISPIRDASGRVTGASTIARDITHRKHAEEQLILRWWPFQSWSRSQCESRRGWSEMPAAVPPPTESDRPSSPWLPPIRAPLHRRPECRLPCFGESGEGRRG